MATVESVRRVDLGLTWKSIFVGFVVGLATQFLLTLLGVAVGLSSFEVSNLKGVGFGAGLWALFVAMVSWFVGGYACSWSSGSFDRGTGILQGVTSWGLGLFLVLFLVGSSVSGVMSTGFGLIGRGAQAAVSAGLLKEGPLSQRAQELRDQAKEQLGQMGPDQAEAVAGTAAKGAWSAFFVAALSLSAAALGGAAGARGQERRTGRMESGERRRPTPPMMTPRTT